MKNRLIVSLLTLFFSLFIAVQVTAQENGIYEVKKERGKSGKEKSENGKYGSRKDFYNLALNLQPTHYIENNSIKKTYNAGDPIKVTIEDSKSFNYLKNKNSKYPNIELIIISLQKPDDIHQSIELSDHKDYKKLKYIYIKCNYNCSEQDVENFVDVDDNIRIFYSKENPS